MFVCTGNICRSPTAERLAANFGGQMGIPDLSTSSAGIRAVIGSPIHVDAARVLESLGGDASDFVARQFTRRIADDADLILVMTTAHRDAVLETAPNKLRRTFTLGEAAQLVSMHGAQSVLDLVALRPYLTDVGLSDIPDPIGQRTEFFGTVGSQIATLVPPILEILRRPPGPSID